MFKGRLLFVNILLLLAVLGSYWGRHIDDATVLQGNFLQTLNIPFHGWKTTDTVMSRVDHAVLEPDSYLLRSYQSPQGDQAQLAIIAGHRKKSIHTPAFCMAGGGWETISEQTTQLRLPGRTVPANRSVMMSGNESVMVTYFFTDGSYCTTSLPSFQAEQLIHRLKSRVPMGALVRIIVPMRTNEAQAETLSNQFAEATIPRVLACLRAAKLVIH